MLARRPRRPPGHPKRGHFDEPTFLTTGEGSVVYGANCPDSYYGLGTGGWRFSCLVASVEDTGVPRNESVVSGRALRSFSLYPIPVPQVHVLVFIEDRPRALIWIGLVTYVLVAVAAAPGVVRLRRDRLALVMLARVLLVVLTSAGGYGTRRFRQAAEVSLVAVPGVGLAALRRAEPAADRGALG